MSIVLYKPYLPAERAYKACVQNVRTNSRHKKREGKPSPFYLNLSNVVTTQQVQIGFNVRLVE